MGNYSKSDSDGFIAENILIENRDIIIAKIAPITENRNDPGKTIKYEDQSKIYRTTENRSFNNNAIPLLEKYIDKCHSKFIGFICPTTSMPFLY